MPGPECKPGNNQAEHDAKNELLCAGQDTAGVIVRVKKNSRRDQRFG